MIRILTLLLMLVTSHAWGATAFVQGDWDQSSGSSTTHQYASGMTVSNGNAIVIAVRWNSGTITSTVADNLGNTYNSCHGPTNNNDNDLRLQIFVAHNITGGGSYTPTVTFSSAVTERAMAFHEVSGVATASPCDGAGASQAQDSPGTGANAISSGNATTTTNGAYIFGAVVTDGSIGAADTVAGTGFTIRPNTTTSCCGSNTIATESQVQVASGNIAATFTHSSGGDTGWITSVVALKDAAAGGGGSIVPIIMHQFNQRRSPH